MKRFSLIVFLVVLLASLSVVAAFAASAYDAQFTTSVTYLNVGTEEAAIVFEFYPENNGTPVQVEATLPADAGASLYVGNVNDIPAGFRGSAVMSSSQPVLATLVQISSDPDVKNRPVSNGFMSGSSEVLLATVLKNQFATTSVFSIQNAHSSSVDVTVELYNAENPAAAPIVVTHNDLPAGAAKYYDMGEIGGLAASFNGSAIITAVDSTTNEPAPVVATSMELSTTGGAASAFEGVISGAATVYMPTALCKAFPAIGGTGSSSAYAVQNTGNTVANVTVAFSGGVTHNTSVQPGAKQSVVACDVAGINPGYSGAATITSTGAPIVVIGKVYGDGNSTAFVGATEGADTLAMPYVRFTQALWENGERQRAYVAIQNVGGSTLAAGSIVVNYVDKDGNLVGTHSNTQPIADGGKFNTNATLATPAAGSTMADLQEFGYIGGFGGGAIVEGPAGSELVGIVRIQSRFGAGVVGEDYNAMPIQ